MDWTQFMQAGQLQDQTGQIDQQLADILMRRKMYQPQAQQHTTGLGALLGGIGDYRAQQAFKDQEGALRQQRGALAGQTAGLRGVWLGDVAQAQQPTPTPPEMLTRPGYDRGADESARQQRLSQLQIAATLSGDPQMAQAGQAMQHQQEFGLTKAMELRKQAETERHNQASEPKVASDIFGRYNLHTGKPIAGGGSGAGGLLSPEAIDQQAQSYIKTGTLPSFGRANPALHSAIIQRASELSGGSDLATGRAGFHSDSASLTKAQAQADSIESFENTALKNLDNFRQVAKSVIDVGSPLFNAPIRTVVNKIGGSAKQAQFNAARQVAVQEIGKVLGGAVQGGAITDSQRHEVEGLLSGDMSLAQIDAVAETLKQDMANRKASVREQLGHIRGRMGGGQQAQPAAAAPAAAGGTVDVISPEGKQGKIPAASLEAALKRGFRRVGP